MPRGNLFLSVPCAFHSTEGFYPLIFPNFLLESPLCVLEFYCFSNIRILSITSANIGIGESKCPADLAALMLSTSIHSWILPYLKQTCYTLNVFCILIQLKAIADKTIPKPRAAQVKKNDLLVPSIVQYLLAGNRVGYSSDASSAYSVHCSFLCGIYSILESKIQTLFTV